MIRYHRLAAMVALILSVVLLSGCLEKEQNWNAKDIQGLMPELAFTLTDTQGNTLTADDLEGQIRLLFFGFTSCPDVCPATLAKLNRAIRAMPPELRGQVIPLFVSVDPGRDTPQRLASYVSFFNDQTLGLTAEEPVLRELAKRYRTTFGYDEPDDQGNYNVSHSSAVYVFDGAGEARLLLTSELSAEQIAQDLSRLATSHPAS